MILAGLCAAAAGQDGGDGDREGALVLRWRWRAGMVYELRTETETTMALEPLGREGEQVLEVAQFSSIKVVEGPRPGTKELRVAFESMNAKLSAAGKTFLYDSEEPGQSHPALKDMLNDSSGFEFGLIYSDDDRFLELGTVNLPVKNPDEEPSLLALANAREVAELFRRSLEMALPRPAVAQGDKWISAEMIKFPQAGSVEVTLNCQFDEKAEREGRPHARIVFDGMMSEVEGGKGGAAKVGGVRLGPRSRVSGQIFYDLERGVNSISVFLALLEVDHEGKRLPVRQAVTTRVEEIRPVD
jgi:hypothetical protein